MLNQNEINKIIETIIVKSDPEKIVLFGSYAYGKPDINSDIDLLVVLRNSDLPRHKRARLIRKYLMGITQTPKDILAYTKKEIDEWQNVEQAFITTIIKNGKILYEKH